jgi:hypothetical protein
MFRTNWKKWALTAVLSAALLPAATFAKTHSANLNAKQPVAAKTSTTASKDKRKLAQKTAPSRELVHRATASKKLVGKTHATQKRTIQKVGPAKLKRANAHQPRKLSTHRKIAPRAKGRTINA